MKAQNYILLFLVGLNITSIIAMKRIGSDLVADNHKRHRGIDCALFIPVKNCDFREFKRCVEFEGTDINQKHKNEHPFFHILYKIDALRIENVHSVHLKDNSKLNEYSIAKNNDAIEELHQCLGLLLKQKTFDYNCTDRLNRTPIEALICRSFKEIYNSAAEKKLKSFDDTFIMRDLLLKKGIFLGPYEDGTFALHYIASAEESTERNLKMVEMLIQSGADINSLSAQGNTPLHCCGNNFKMVLLLLALGAQHDKVNQAGEIPADVSEDSLVSDMLTSTIEIEKYKNDMRDALIKGTCTDTNMPNILKFIVSRQVQSVSTPCHIYPYTHAVLEYTKDIPVEEKETHFFALPEEQESGEDSESSDSEFGEDERTIEEI